MGGFTHRLPYTTHVFLGELRIELLTMVTHATHKNLAVLVDSLTIAGDYGFRIGVTLSFNPATNYY